MSQTFCFYEDSLTEHEYGFRNEIENDSDTELKIRELDLSNALEEAGKGKRRLSNGSSDEPAPKRLNARVAGKDDATRADPVGEETVQHIFACKYCERMIHTKSRMRKDAFKPWAEDKFVAVYCYSCASRLDANLLPTTELGNFYGDIRIHEHVLRGWELYRAANEGLGLALCGRHGRRPVMTINRVWHLLRLLQDNTSDRSKPLMAESIQLQRFHGYDGKDTYTTAYRPSKDLDRSFLTPDDAETAQPVTGVYRHATILGWTRFDCTIRTKHGGTI